MKERDEVARRDGSPIYKGSRGYVYKIEKWRDGRTMVAVLDGSACVWHERRTLRATRRAVGEGLAIRWMEVRP